MKIALVTGASRGLGKSMALHLADRGADVILTYHSRLDEAAQVVAAIEAKGRKAVALRLDISDTCGLEAFVQLVKANLQNHWGCEAFDYLVNNAGIGQHALVSETTEEQFDLLFNIHLKAPFFLTQKLLPLIRDGGRILNITTGLVRFAFPGYSAYAAMKGGLEVVTRYLAKELGERRITVNSLAPGAIETDFGGGAVRDNPELNKMVSQLTALGRAGLTDDIGGAAAALLSDDCGWINGQRIEAAGGIFI